MEMSAPPTLFSGYTVHGPFMVRYTWANVALRKILDIQWYDFVGNADIRRITN